MKQAEARLRAEAAASNEEAIEDRKSEPKQEEAGKSGDQTNGPVGSIEDKREDPMKNSPNVEDTPKPARSHPPTTPPPPYPPVQDVRSAGLKTPEPGERRRRGADEGKESQRLQTPREDRTGIMGSREGQKSEVEQTPLFTEEQVRALHSLHGQAPWVVSVWSLSFLSLSASTTSRFLRSRRRQIERVDRKGETATADAR